MWPLIVDDDNKLPTHHHHHHHHFFSKKMKKMKRRRKEEEKGENTKEKDAEKRETKNYKKMKPIGKKKFLVAND
jgi:hypothetical protein